VVLAVPTIPERHHRREGLEKLWRERTPEADLEIVYSEAGESWCAGLNDIWAQVKDNPPDVFIFGSDDFVPGDERWLPSIEPVIAEGKLPAPLVEDPRFTSCGGFLTRVPEGTIAGMTAFIIIDGKWGDIIFPLPEDLHYFGDNAACALLLLAGIPCVTVSTCRMIHLHASEGRGAGYGSENTRLYIDTVRYTRFLESRGIDRLTLPESVRGHMWEEHHQEVGRKIGA
jgi:hypothetical protein